MPVIRVEMFKRTQKQKRNLVKELTDAFVKTCGGNSDAIKILITEVNKNDVVHFDVEGPSKVRCAAPLPLRPRSAPAPLPGI